MAPSARDPLRMRAYVAAVHGVCAVLVLYVIVANLPYAAVQLRAAYALHVRLWIPEGWAFFTRNPREPRMSIYRRHDGGWSGLSAMQSPARTWLGLHRGARAQGVEAGQLLETVGRTAWFDCGSLGISDCVAQAEKDVITVGNHTTSAVLCGELAIVMQEPVPWAWSGSRRRIDMPSQLVRISAKC